MTDTARFFVVTRNYFGALQQSQVDGFNSLLKVLDGLPLRWEAYALATAWHETATTMRPIEEYGKGRGRPYGVPAGPWHQVYDGRGDVQLTWERNYAHATARLRKLGIISPEVDLEKIPGLAMQPEIAGAIIRYGMVEGWFTGKKFADFTDFVSMRRIINGVDKATLIAHYADVFLAALSAAQATTH